MKGVLFMPWKLKYIATHPGMELQTRRVIKPQPEPGLSIGCYYGKGYPTEFVLVDLDGDAIDAECPQPRFQVGDIAYIKEAWRMNHAIASCPKLDDKVAIEYAGSLRVFQMQQINYSRDGSRFMYSISKAFDKPGKWQSARIMPEVIALHYIEITGRKAERLRQISLVDCRAECFGDHLLLANLRFINTWDTINKGYPWGSNPWVYAYTFHLIEGVNSETMPEMSQATN